MSSQTTTTTITALLDSLHKHLLAQTELLPALHSQLGLHPDALQEDLRSLQEELVKGVERQVDLRRQEVDEWMSKCDAAEQECIRYSTALRGYVKSTGISVGELRKESVLPHRFNLVSEHQEKLKQLYDNKLEQLQALSQRLKSLTPTLGTTFFDSDVLKPISLQEDSSVLLDVSPDSFLKLEKELVRAKSEVNKRLQHLFKEFIQIDILYAQLGIAPPTVDNFSSSSISTSHSSSDPFLDSPSPTPQSHGSCSTMLYEDETEKQNIQFEQIFAHCVARAVEIEGIYENIEKPEIRPEHVAFTLPNVIPIPELLSWTESLRHSLQDLKDSREVEIQGLYDQLEYLWRRLGVDAASADGFVEANRGSTEAVVQSYREELERMLELKQDMMADFIESARKELVVLWDSLMVGEEERADFSPFADDEKTDEILALHEEEVRRLKAERKSKLSILSGIKKYLEICEEEKELALAASDQTRLLGRGPPGRLLREEKMRKRVSKEKPRLEQDLLSSIPTWERETGRPFLVYGESFLQKMMESVTSSDLEMKRKPGRSGSVPLRATTPVSSNNQQQTGLRPNSRTGVVTPAVRSSSMTSSNTLPNKRQKLGHNVAATPLNGTGRPRSRSNTQTRAPSPSSRIPTKTPGASAVKRSTSASHTYGTKNIGKCASTTRSASSGAKLGPNVYHGKLPQMTKSLPGAKASRVKRESFKPRPSTDDLDLDIDVARYSGGLASSKEEEEENY